MVTQPISGPVPHGTDYNEVRDKAAEVMDYPDIWMVTPNEHLGFKRPDELIHAHGEAGKKLVTDLVGAIREGMFV
jgi:uncharacterized protein (DUF2384 family)